MGIFSCKEAKVVEEETFLGDTLLDNFETQTQADPAVEDGFDSSLYELNVLQ